MPRVGSPRRQPPACESCESCKSCESCASCVISLASGLLRRGSECRGGDRLVVELASALAILPSGTPLLRMMRMVAPAVMMAVTRAVTTATASSANLLYCAASRVLRACGVSLPADFLRFGLSGRSGCRSFPARSWRLGKGIPVAVVSLLREHLKHAQLECCAVIDVCTTSSATNKSACKNPLM